MPGFQEHVVGVFPLLLPAAMQTPELVQVILLPHLREFGHHRIGPGSRLLDQDAENVEAIVN
jgi:hypothetical protein